MAHFSLDSPLGPLTITDRDGAITGIAWGWSPGAVETDLLGLAGRQLGEYFAGDRRDFALPLSPAGSEFQRRVWATMLDIPFGETRSYGALAGAVGSVARAVAGACARNPIPIVIPCHRVIGTGGGLTGYSGGQGIATKRLLLDHEAGDAHTLL